MGNIYEECIYNKTYFYFFLMNYFNYFDNLNDYIINSCSTLFFCYPFLDYKLKEKILKLSNSVLYNGKGCNLGLKIYPYLLQIEGKAKGYHVKNFVEPIKAKKLRKELIFGVFNYVVNFLL